MIRQKTRVERRTERRKIGETEKIGSLIGDEDVKKKKKLATAVMNNLQSIWSKHEKK